MKNFFQYTSTELGNLLYFVLWVLWFFFMIAQCGAMSLLNSYLWRIYQTFFVNGLVGYHLMMSKQRFCTNLNSFLPKVNLNCACVLCWFQLFLSDHLAEKRKRIAGRKVAYKDIDLKFLFELLGISELSIIVFFTLHCIVLYKRRNEVISLLLKEKYIKR